MRRRGISLIALLLLSLLFQGCAAGSGWKPFEIQMYPDFVRTRNKVVGGVVLVKVVRAAVDKKGKTIPANERRTSGGGVVLASREARPGVYELAIVTNNHVIEDARKITIRLLDVDDFFSASVVGFDDFLDFALLRVETPYKVPALAMGDPRKLRVGELTYAIGHPHGQAWTLSVGVISNLWRGTLVDIIQFDGTFGPGNSGGGLFNLKGELIGIPNSYFRENTRVGFAISVHELQKSLPSLMKGGRVPHGSFGAIKFLGLDDLSPETEEALATPPPPYKLQAGVFVIDIPEGSPARRAGMTHGDVIVEINGRVVYGPFHLRRLIADSAPGVQIPVKVIRRKTVVILNVIPIEREEE